MSEQQANDPLNFMRNMWGNMGFSLPGMVAPTFDLEELDKRIKDLKAVEGWLRMNLSMLQMTIQGLEMQRTTVNTVQTMGQMASEAARKMGDPAAPEAPVAEAAPNSFEAAMWPWQMMEQMREKMQQSADAAAASQAETGEPEKSKNRRSTAKK
ncbi:PhaM family polyhydroxyalkanoate granule multifunctional regulatory protein [Azonexus sp.]|uniref:PhaM family polyhydroxyalkanoate granule multifunctional regulatory protein n=1 Tax=Azonexus sp. TaxID=1872668 RepID=UPI0027B9575B|nr:PhaM family polyhydroxyalkanoate granule multifunctional regulatory protein [Azonexus sp.]